MLKKLKKKSGQAIIEFTMIISLLLMVLLGTYDLFNLSVSYMQMTFLGNTFLSANLMNQNLGRRDEYRLSNDDTAGDEAAKAVREHGVDSNGFPLYFFFGQSPSHKNGDWEFCADYDKKSAAGKKNAIGTAHCIIIQHNVDLITGKAFFKTPSIRLKKTVCGVQEKTFRSNSLPRWKPCTH